MADLALEPPPALPEDLEFKRFSALSGLAGILPYQRRDELSALLTDADIATLRHLAETGMGANTLRALASDLAYLERWALAATGSPLPWPAPEALAAKFIAHHLWDKARRETNPDHGMPAAVMENLWSCGALRSDGPHAPGTVKRRLALWSTMHQWRGLNAPFGAPQVRQALRLAVRASARPRQRKSEKAVTGDIVQKLLQTCIFNRLVDVRDRAMIVIAFASGGRRRSEIAAMRVEDIAVEPDLPADPAVSGSAALPCRSIRLGRTKTTDADDAARAYITGQAVRALEAWLTRAGITQGYIFRAIDQWEHISAGPLEAQALNVVLKKRIAMAGLDPKQFSAHGLRSGYLTEAARQGVPLTEAMAQSQHKSIQQAAKYYNDSERRMGRAARLLG